ncbi:DUF5691 domain-containing protein [Flammeovirga sp. SJP92]|uniref:DUF5691 domain-containing protein n=1 Tax=Flammeovirga sp. SJP92 TaxID=1775430 RepID=UPI000788070E|nr:DUF5691 domain-containing protein [Flammeovirga sp. SJP92]KXX72386.1 hypothetical protein AVL50_01940 [Flammeovirga sp. SJP92]
MWKHLVETGFLGTDRKQIQKDQLPEQLLNQLEKVDEQDKENHFLTLLSFAQYYNESGEVAKKYEGEVLAEYMEEKRFEIPHSMQLIFSRINNLDTSFTKTKLIHLWLDLIIKKEQVVGYPLFKDLIKFGERKGVEIKDKITKVLSRNTLKACMQFHQVNNNWIATPISEEGWYTGKMAERKSYLEYLLGQDIPKAIALLEEAWPQETLNNKVSLLNTIFEKPSESLVPFLEKLYDNEYQFSETEKEKQREGRAILSKILLMFPSSKLSQETLQQLVPCFTKRALISKLKWKLNFPKEQSDGFWNEKSMLQKYGLDINGFMPHNHSTKEEGWMAYFIQYIPFQAFADALNTKEEHIINCLFDSKELQQKIKYADGVESMFINELTHKVRFYQAQSSVKLVQAFIERRNHNDYELKDILFSLQPDEIEELIVKNNIYRTSINIMCNYSSEVPDLNFSYSLSKKLLQKIQRKSEDWRYGVSTDQLGLILSKDILGELEIINKKVESMTLAKDMSHDAKEEDLQTWKNKIYIPIKEVIEIRTLLEEEEELVTE